MILLYHGGKDLELNYKEVKAARTGKWEFGCGLYLTNNIERAQDYAKGSRSLYKVGIDLSEMQPISRSYIPIGRARQFVATHVKTAKRQEIMNDLERWNDFGYIRAEVINNMMINRDALSPSKTPDLTQFLVEHGADYLLDGVTFTANAGQGKEQTLVVFNRDAIKKVEKLSANKIKEDDYEIKERSIYHLPQCHHVLDAYHRILSQFEAEHGQVGAIEIDGEIVASINNGGYLSSYLTSASDLERTERELDIHEWDSNHGNWDGMKYPHSLDFDALRKSIRPFSDYQLALNQAKAPCP